MTNEKAKKTSHDFASQGATKPPRDLLMLTTANLLWGSTDVVAKFAVRNMTPATATWLRLSFALLVFAPFLFKAKREIPRSFPSLMPFVALGLSGFFLNHLLNYHGIRFAPASHASALRVLETMVIMLLSAGLLREPVGKWSKASLVAGMLGVTMVLNIDFNQIFRAPSGFLLGDLFILGVVILEGAYAVTGKWALKRASPLMTTALACLSGWCMLSVVCGYSIVIDLAQNPPSPGAILACIYLGFFCSGLGFYLYHLVLSRQPSHRVGVSLVIQPLVGVPLAALLFREGMTPGFVAGMFLISMSVYFVLWREKE